ncbi:MAG: CehA/McbA family metallohydrolase [Herpetosiphon sp.]
MTPIHVPTQPFSKADLHVHTSASDGIASAEAILQSVAESRTMRVIAITDHDTVKGALTARSLEREFGVEVIVGEEVSTQEGHLLALFIDQHLQAGRPAAETIAAVHAQGGLCIAPHPYDWLIPSVGKAGLRSRCAGKQGDSERRDWHFDGIEVLNASISWPGWVGNALAQRVATELDLPGVGGSDGHTLDTIGRAFTSFPGTSANDLYRAIKTSTVSAGGQRWSLNQYVDFYAATLRQRSISGALKLAVSNVTLLQ